MSPSTGLCGRDLRKWTQHPNRSVYAGPASPLDLGTVGTMAGEHWLRKATWLRWTITLLAAIIIVLTTFALWDHALRAMITETLASAASQPPALTFCVIVALLALDIPLPIPSSLISTAAGALLGANFGILATTVGMTSGCLAGYGLGRFGHVLAGRSWLSQAELERARELSRRHGDWALVVARPIPVLAEISVVFAGLSRARFSSFMMSTTLANFSIACVYGFAGAAAGEWDDGLASAGWTLAIAIALPALAMPVRSRLRNTHPPN